VHDDVQSWYTASLIFESKRVQGEPPKDSLWEESIYLLAARSEAEAATVARKLGLSNETEFNAADGHRIRWTFVEVQSIHEVCADHIAHGIELFSRFLDEGQLRALLKKPALSEKLVDRPA